MDLIIATPRRVSPRRDGVGELMSRNFRANDNRFSQIKNVPGEVENIVKSDHDVLGDSCEMLLSFLIPALGQSKSCTLLIISVLGH